MNTTKFRVVVLTHGGAGRLLELLGGLDRVIVAGVFLETVTLPERSLKQKITRSVLYDGYFNTVNKFLSKVLNRATPATAELQDILSEQNDIQKSAEKLGIPVYKVDNYHSPSSIDLLAKANADLGIIYGTNIIKKPVFDLPRLGSINLHQGLAPYYRGGPTVFWELFNGEREIGITIHFVAPEVDTGDIVLQEKIPLIYDFSRYGLDYESFLRDVRTTLAEPSARTMVEAVKMIANDHAKPIKQDTSVGRRYRLPTKKEKDKLLKTLKSRQQLIGTHYSAQERRIGG